jgi:lipoprotein-anchoring transpeptidase ErfK/SrfK
MKRLTGITALAALGIALGACTSGGTTAARPAGDTASAAAQAGGKASASAPAKPPGPVVTITPASGANADPSKGITVTTNGTLKNVSVHTSGDPVTGSYSSGNTTWHSTWTLDVSQSYTVTATATAADGTTTRTSTFRTLTPSSTFTTEIIEGQGQSYGVGMPIILYFDHSITNKAAVEKALQLKTSKPVIGAWYWDQPCGMAADCLYFRPRDYWPTGTTVSFTGHLDGVEAAPGVYGFHTLTQTFNIGRSLIAVGDTQTHHTQIYVNDKLTYDWPISSGRPGDDTPDGSYLTIEKENPVLMTGPGYSLEVPYSVRFTFSGDYYHDAYWSVGEQGFENVSHGCVNLSPADAQIYYNMAVPGDPITIKGSPKAGTWDNGYTEWFLSWSQYLKGSALHEAVEAGPNGSTFVSPSSLPKDTAKAPLQTAAAGNADV